MQLSLLDVDITIDIVHGIHESLAWLINDLVLEPTPGYRLSTAEEIECIRSSAFNIHQSFLESLSSGRINSSDVSDVFEYLGHRKDFNNSVSTFIRNEELAEFI